MDEFISAKSDDWRHYYDLRRVGLLHVALYVYIYVQAWTPARLFYSLRRNVSREKESSYLVGLNSRATSTPEMMGDSNRVFFFRTGLPPHVVREACLYGVYIRRAPIVFSRDEKETVTVLALRLLSVRRVVNLTRNRVASFHCPGVTANAASFRCPVVS